MEQEQQEKTLSYLELRALLEIDWCDLAPNSADQEAWISYWAHLEDYLGLEIPDSTLEIYNATLGKDQAFSSLNEVRAYVRRQLAVVDRWVDESKYSND